MDSSTSVSYIFRRPGRAKPLCCAKRAPSMRSAAGADMSAAVFLVKWKDEGFGGRSDHSFGVRPPRLKGPQ